MVAITYESWLVTRGSKYSDLTWKLWYFLTLVVKEGWSQLEDRLFVICFSNGRSLNLFVCGIELSQVCFQEHCEEYTGLS